MRKITLTLLVALSVASLSSFAGGTDKCAKKCEKGTSCCSKTTSKAALLKAKTKTVAASKKA